MTDDALRLLNESFHEPMALEGCSCESDEEIGDEDPCLYCQVKTLLEKSGCEVFRD